MWRKGTKACLSDGSLCVRQAETFIGLFYDACHWWQLPGVGLNTLHWRAKIHSYRTGFSSDPTLKEPFVKKSDEDNLVIKIRSFLVIMCIFKGVLCFTGDAYVWWHHCDAALWMMGQQWHQVVKFCNKPPQNVDFHGVNGVCAFNNPQYKYKVIKNVCLFFF